MENDSEPEEGNLVLMVSPTTGRVLLVLSGGLALFSRIEFSGIEAVDTFAGQLNEELTAVKQLLGHRLSRSQNRSHTPHLLSTL